MTKVLDAIHTSLKVLLGVLLVGLLIPVTMQILSRYGGILPRYIWTEEIARFCFVWIIMLGAICAVRDRSHFDLEVFPENRNQHIQLFLDLVVHGAILTVGGVFIWYGIKFLQFGWYQTSEIFELPMNYIFAAWPLAGVLFIAFELEHVAQTLRDKRGAQP